MQRPTEERQRHHQNRKPTDVRQTQIQTCQHTEKRQKAQNPTEARQMEEERQNALKPTEERQEAQKLTEARHKTSEPTEERQEAQRPSEVRQKAPGPTEERLAAQKPTEARQKEEERQNALKPTEERQNDSVPGSVSTSRLDIRAGLEDPEENIATGRRTSSTVPSRMRTAPGFDSTTLMRRGETAQAAATREAETARTRGGDIMDCLSDGEVDLLCRHEILCDSRLFFDVARRHTSFAQARDRITAAIASRAGRSDPLMLIIHVRHHWVLAVLAVSRGSIVKVTVYDSARSLLVQKDLSALARQLEWPEPLYFNGPQQRRGSNECGLFAAATALLLGRGYVLPEYTDRVEVSLHRLRDLAGNSEAFFAAAREALGARQQASQLVAGAGKPHPQQQPSQIVVSAKGAADRKPKEEAARKSKGEADRRPEAEAESKAKADAARTAKEEADCKAKEAADRKAKLAAEHKAKEEAKRKTRDVAALKAKEDSVQARIEEEYHRAYLLAETDPEIAELRRLGHTSPTAESAIASSTEDRVLALIDRALVPGQMVATELMDELLALAAARGKIGSRPAEYCIAASTAPRLPRRTPHGITGILQPMFHNNHFVLVRYGGSAAAVSSIDIWDSIPNYYVHQRNAQARTTAQTLNMRVEAHNAGLQPAGSNDCAFYTLKAALELGGRKAQRWTRREALEDLRTEVLRRRAARGASWLSPLSASAQRTQSCLDICGQSCLGFCVQDSHEQHTREKSTNNISQHDRPPLSPQQIHEAIRACTVGDCIDVAWRWESAAAEQRFAQVNDLQGSVPFPQVVSWRARITKAGRNLTAETEVDGVIRELLIPSQGVAYCSLRRVTEKIETIPRADNTTSAARSGPPAAPVVAQDIPRRPTQDALPGELSRAPLHRVVTHLNQGLAAPRSTAVAAPDATTTAANAPTGPWTHQPYRPVHATPAPPPALRIWRLADIRELAKRAKGHAIEITCRALPGDRVADDVVVVARGHVRGDTDMDFAVDAFMCEECGGWQAETEALVVPLTETLTYYNVRIIEAAEDLLCSCCDEAEPEVPSGTATPDFAAELLPDASLGFATGDVMTAWVASKWHLPLQGQQPAHVHTIVWRQLARTTRSAHIRWLAGIKAMATPLKAVPLGRAVVQMILEEAQRSKWTSWATVSSALSSVASALRSLPIYTRATAGIDIRHDPHFSAAAKRAQHLARITKRFDSADAMTVEQAAQILKEAKAPAIRLFFAVAWACAARIGDLRQVHGADVAFGAVIDGARGPVQLVKITFRYGKGACFWGPFTIQFTLDRGVAKDLAARCRLHTNATLFSPAEQQQLSQLVAAVKTDKGSLNLRSIRKGRLISLAKAGASSAELALLSGHKRMDTLYRYLGWGVWSADARAAAIARAQVDGGAPPELDIWTEEIIDGDDSFTPAGPQMGPHSGYCGQQGRRVASPPVRISCRPPKRRDLGLCGVDSSGWPLKAKPMKPFQRDKLGLLSSSNAGDATLGNDLITAEAWTAIDAKLQDCDIWCGAAPLEAGRPEAERKIDPTHIPVSHIKRADFTLMNQADKVRCLSQPEMSNIKGWATASIVPQPSRQQRRPVFDLRCNQWPLDGIPFPTYPPRRVRRMLRGFPYRADLDFSQFFDQFSLTEEAMLYYVIRYKVEEEDGSSTEVFVKLTRLPMGTRFAPGVAQGLTDVIVAPLAALPDVRCFSMIDNIRIAAKSRSTFLQAIKIVLARIKAIGLTLNDLDSAPATELCEERHAPVPSCLQRRQPDTLSDADWIAWAGVEGSVFLGEQYGNCPDGSPGIRNTTKNVLKLREAWQRLQALLPDRWSAERIEAAARSATDRVTIRHLVSLISLVLWMLHTVDKHLVDEFGLLRSYSRLAQLAVSKGWDAELTYLDERLRQTLQERVVALSSRAFVPLPVPDAEWSDDNAHYDAVITVDASEACWAAMISTREGKSFLLRQDWRAADPEIYRHSTVAEPTAALRAIQWTLEWFQRTKGVASPRLALVTDHMAIVTGQARQDSHLGGFSRNPYLNALYSAMQRHRIRAWFVPGVNNPADGPSRCPGAGPRVLATAINGFEGLALASLDRTSG